MKPFSAEEREKKIYQIDALKERTGDTDSQFKNDYLYINSIELDLKEQIFRIFNYDYFIKDLQTKNLTLVRPHWVHFTVSQSIYYL